MAEDIFKLIPRDVISSDSILGYSQDKEVVLLNQSAGNSSNTHAEGDISQTGQSVQFTFGLVTATVERLNTTEIRISLSASENLSIGYFYRLTSPSSLLSDADSDLNLGIDQTPILTIQLGTYNLAEFWIHRDDQSYFITAWSNNEKSKAWLNITRYN